MCEGCSKCFYKFFNFLLLAWALSLVGTGIFLAINTNMNIYVIIIFAFGGVQSILAAIGLFLNKGIMVYIIATMILLALEAIAIVLGFVFKEKVAKYIEEQTQIPFATSEKNIIIAFCNFAVVWLFQVFLLFIWLEILFSSLV